MSFLALSFLREALTTSLLAGTALSVLGVFVLMRRVAFSGLSVAQLAALGTVGGILAGFHFGAYVLALVVVMAGLFFLERSSGISRLPQEAWMACLYVLGSALSVLILAKAPMGEAHTLNVFFGNVLTLGKTEMMEAAGLLLTASLAVGLAFYRWLWISFDNISPRVAGMRVGWWNLAFYALFALSMTAAIHLLGVLLAFSYMVLPAATGLLFTRRLRSLFILVPLATWAATLAGFWLSFRWDFPPGPFIACLLAACTFLAGVYRLARS